MRKWWAAALTAGALHAAVIRGVVVENQSGKPLLRATVTLKPLSGTAAATQTVRTNTSGVFEFTPVPGGAYLVSAARRNYYSVQYGQKDWRAAGAPVLVDETASAFLPIRLPKLGVITGRVVDENDVGLPNHDVVAFRNTRPPQLVSKVTADERGVYRLFDLEPGPYLVKTVAREYDEGSYIPTFSKDALKVEEARGVEVLLDQEAERVDVRPAPGKLYKIGGRVLPSAMNPEDGNPVSVKLTFASDMGRETVQTSGGFRFPPVPPGDYELYADGPGDGTALCPAIGGYMPLTIRDRDRAEIDFPVPCVRDTSFQLIEKKGMQVEFSKLKLFARRKDMAGAGEPQQLEIRGSRYNGSVRLAPGRWELMAIPSSGYCVIEFGGRYSRSEGTQKPRADGWNEILIGVNFNSIRVVLSSSPGTLHGMVSGIAREPVAGAPVFLEGYDPDSRRRVAELRTVFTDARGQYRFTDLAPGSYRVLSSFEFQSPDQAVMDLAGAKLVNIEEAKDLPQDLDLSVIR
jgi:hypothetical protein